MASSAVTPDPRVTNLSIHDQLARRLGGTLTVGVSGSNLCRDYGVPPSRALRILQDFAALKYPTRMVSDELCVFGKGGAEVYAKSARDSRRDAEKLKRRRVDTAGPTGKRQRGRRDDRKPDQKKRKHHSSDRRVALATKRLIELAAATAQSSAGGGVSTRRSSSSAAPAPPPPPSNDQPTLLEPTYLTLLKSRKRDEEVALPSFLPGQAGIEGRMFDAGALPLGRGAADKVSTLEALVLSHGLAHPSPHVQQSQLQNVFVDSFGAAPAGSAAAKSVGACHTGKAAEQLNRISATTAFPSTQRQHQQPSALPLELIVTQPIDRPSDEAALLGCPWVFPNGHRNPSIYKQLAARVVSLVAAKPACSVVALLPELGEGAAGGGLTLTAQQLRMFLALLVQDQLLRRELPASCAKISAGFGCRVRLRDLAQHTHMGAGQGAGGDEERAVYFIV